MNVVEKIQNEVYGLPEPLQQEVLDFIGYLEARHGLIKPKVGHDGQRNVAQAAVQSVAAFRGSGKGGGTKRLLATRRADREQEV
ncbi:MAG: DUF2281 domain-containing protein [Magnetococcus sp. XQGC-1]